MNTMCTLDEGYPVQQLFFNITCRVKEYVEQTHFDADIYHAYVS